MHLSPSILLKDAIYRLTTKVSSKAYPRNLKKRMTSYPFLAPDTYLDYCSESILNKSELIDFIHNAKNKSLIDSLYIVGELVNDLIVRIDKIKSVKINKLIIMESDTTQKVENLQTLLPVANEIFSNNLIGNLEKIAPIPLGLERRAYRSAGVLSHYRKDFSLNPNKRKIDFLVAWNDDTNTKRKKYRELFIDSKRGLVIDRRMHPRSIHELMRNSLFIPSPAGNGYDCHRTWEALYLGAIPVILKSEFCGNSSWPVLLVDEWNDLIKLSRPELEKLYESRAISKEAVLEFSENILRKIS
jgi:hypothetical protein